MCLTTHKTWIRGVILLIDNYDSFTYNLAHLLGKIGHEFHVVRNDSITPDIAVGGDFSGIVLSPGPGMPASAGACLDIISAASGVNMPVFGVCLGMQAIAESFGAKVGRASRLMHGKTSQIHHTARGVFADLPQDFQATRYHSLSVEKDSLPKGVLNVTAHSVDDGEIMALEHESAPIAGVQFHPESSASEHGVTMLRNFFNAAEGKTAAAPAKQISQ